MNSAKVIYLPSHCSCTRKIIRLHVRKGGAGHWHGLMIKLGWLGPTQLCKLARSSPVTWAGLGPARKKKELFQKNPSFLQIFYTVF
jgi:hypothetical protein